MDQPAAPNQNPEQRARDRIDLRLAAAGWAVQNRKDVDLNAARGVAVREYPTDAGPADYALFVDGRPVGVVEAKPDTWGHKITTVEEQSQSYAHAVFKWINNSTPLPFVYESTGAITRFTHGRDPKPRSHEVFTFHRPETLKAWFDESRSLRARLATMPPLDSAGLRACQINAIANLEASFKQDRPRALIQMATGAGKTYTAITSIYRLLKHADAGRVLFLVDTRNLGEQAEQEFFSYQPNDDNRLFTELYTVQRLKSPHIAPDSQVCISTIQRMYSILKGEELDEAAEESAPAESFAVNRKPLPVVYNPKLPIEFFDFIVIDECHRSIYNLWRQVLDYFDAYLIGLTATPDNRTYGFFQKNVVSEYDHEKAVADGVNVGNEIYVIETERGLHGGTLQKDQQVQKRERVTRKRRWERQDEDEAYTAKQLDRDIVNPDQIRTVIRTFRDRLPEIFPGRYDTDGQYQVPKTLVFAKTDSHADDIIQTMRDEFGEGNDFCKKVTYRADDPKSVLASFRNEYNPRIAVTVDMIATGTDVKPLECLLFMRDVKSRNYFEQMKGRGTRTLDHDDLKKVTPAAASAKTHYVIVDAIGVTRSLKTAGQPLITKPGVSLKNLAMGVMMGAARDEDSVSSLAGRLARLNQQLDGRDRERIREQAGGKELAQVTSDLLSALDADRIDTRARQNAGLPDNTDPGDDQRETARAQLVGEAAKVFTGPLIELLDGIRRDKEQTIDYEGLDQLITSEWADDTQANAEKRRDDFESWLETNRDEIEALTIFYSQPQRRADVTYEMIRQVLDKLRADRPGLAPLRVWQAYAHLDELKSTNPQTELTALVALIRRACGIDRTLSPHAETVRRNFQNWIMARHSAPGTKFTDEQLDWLHMIRNHMIDSFHIERDDFDMAPFDAKGGLGQMYELFGDDMERVIGELNEALVA